MHGSHAEIASNGSCFKARGLTKIYGSGHGAVRALRGVDLDLPAGELVVFLGASGSGKSTLLNNLGGLDRPTSGSVQVGGEELAGLSDRSLAAWRARHVGFVFQLYNLLPVLTAERNVELPLLLTSLKRSARKKHVETALSVVGLGHRLRHFPRQLSGGEQQRVGIARAIVTDPTL